MPIVNGKLQPAVCTHTSVAVHVAGMRRMIAEQTPLRFPTAEDLGEFCQVVERGEQLAAQHAAHLVELASSGAPTEEVGALRDRQRRIAAAAARAMR